MGRGGGLVKVGGGGRGGVKGNTWNFSRSFFFSASFSSALWMVLTQSAWGWTATKQRRVYLPHNNNQDSLNLEPDPGFAESGSWPR